MAGARTSLGGSIATIIVSEPAIHGVILVAGLVVILGNSDEASWDVLVKVIATLVVFWAAHVYAGAVATSAMSTKARPPGGRARSRPPVMRSIIPGACSLPG